jgi:hypothetical protein
MKNYYRELNKVQRQIPHIDIVTFTGFMDKDEKLAHLDYYAKQVGYKVNLND